MNRNNLEVFTDTENQENVGVRTRNRNAVKRAHTQGSQDQAAPQRTVLGQVTNNVRQQRQQPARAAKTSFKVYEDDAENAVQLLRPPLRTSRRTGQSARLPALAQLSSVTTSQLPSRGENTSYDEVFNSAAESPMMLDVSCMDTDEDPEPRPVVDRDLSLYCLHEYQDDIHDYLRSAELRNRPKLNYMRKQTDISPTMRTILVDWLVEVGEEYKLHDETLHLAVNYIDRFLSQMSVLRGKLQLVGTACMFIASKYEEIYPPDVGEFVYITDDTYTKKQLLRMEHLVIKVLGFEVASPTANVFADLYCRQLGVSEQTKCMTQYIMELSLLDVDNYIVYRPSVIASASLFLAVDILCENAALSSLEKVTRYRQADIMACAKRLMATLHATPEQPQQAVRDKYKSDTKRAVSLFTIPDIYEPRE